MRLFFKNIKNILQDFRMLVYISGSVYKCHCLNVQCCRGYMELVFTSSVCISCIWQAGWKENHATFMSELKNLQASGLTTLGHALRAAFDLLNLNRLVSGIDNYGQVIISPFSIQRVKTISIQCNSSIIYTAV